MKSRKMEGFESERLSSIRQRCDEARPFAEGVGDGGGWYHPDAELIHDGEWRDTYKCPHCGLTCHIHLPDA